MNLTKGQRQFAMIILAVIAIFVFVRLTSTPNCNDGCAPPQPGTGSSSIQVVQQPIQPSNAQPSSVQPSSDLPSPGTAEYNNFVTEVTAESIYTSDTNPGGTGTDGAANWLEMGDQACALLGASGPGQAVSVLEGQGYDSTGAEAIVAASARILCSDEGYAGWYTNFDKELGSSANDIGFHFGTTISYNNVRTLAQTECRYIGSNNAGGDSAGGQLSSYLATHTVMPEPSSNQPRIDYTISNNVKWVVTNVWSHACNGLTIPQFWTTYG